MEAYVYKLSFYILLFIIGFAIFIKISILECKKFNLKDQTGKIFIITGANSGLGLFSSYYLSKAGAHVIMACRNITKGKEARSNILKNNPKASLKLFELDLTSFDSVKKFASSISKNYKSIDVLINNAAEWTIERKLTVDGVERHIGVNHLSHFLLTSLLLPKLSEKGRIINVSSGAYIFARNNFVKEDFQSSNNYNPLIAYGNSKAANLYFTYELNKRLEQSKSKKISIATHPGYTATNLLEGKVPFWSYLCKFIAMKIEDGALAQIIAATDPIMQPSINSFFGPKYLMFGYPSVQYTGKSDIEAQEELWDISVQITGAKFKMI